MPTQRSKAAVIRRKQKTVDLVTVKSAVLGIIDELQSENYITQMSATRALDLAARRVRRWRP